MPEVRTAIYRAGGPEILDDCRNIVAASGPCHPGDAVVTGAGELPAGLVIHTVGPVWTEDDAKAHQATLTSCYQRSLDLGQEHAVRTIAFPNISTGAYRFPKAAAASVALGAVIEWLESNPDHGYSEIIFACFDEQNRSIYELLLEDRF